MLNNILSPLKISILKLSEYFEKFSDMFFKIFLFIYSLAYKRIKVSIQCSHYYYYILGNIKTFKTCHYTF